jgi:dTDP-glucose 4,6-dehydratase
MISKTDVATALILALGSRKAGIFNLGSDDPPSVKDLILHVIRKTGSRSIRLFIPNNLLTGVLKRADHLNLAPLSPEQCEIAGIEYVLDTSDTKRELDWEPTQSDKEILEESLRQ